MGLNLPSLIARLYTASRQLIAGDDFNNIVSQLNTSQNTITAHAGGGQAAATQLGKAFNRITTVANANDSVKLPKGFAGLEVWIRNDSGANAAQVYTYGTGTIDGTDGVATGVALNNATLTIYRCLEVTAAGEAWYSK